MFEFISYAVFCLKKKMSCQLHVQRNILFGVCYATQSTPVFRARYLSSEIFFGADGPLRVGTIRIILSLMFSMASVRTSDPSSAEEFVQKAMRALVADCLSVNGTEVRAVEQGKATTAGRAVKWARDASTMETLAQQSQEQETLSSSASSTCRWQRGFDTSNRGRFRDRGRALANRRLLRPTVCTWRLS